MKKLSAALLLYLGLASAALAQTFSMPPPAGVTVVGCVYNLSPPTLLTATAGFMQCDSTGKLIVSGGGGGGGAVTIADGADVAEGATSDTATTAGSTGTVSAKLRLMTTQLGTINTTLGTPFQAGGSIGNTTFASTQSGTWNINNISGTVSLPTGAATSAAQTTMATNQTAVQAPVTPSAATATKANLIAGQYNSAVQAFTNGQQGSLQFDQRGGLLIQDGQAIPSVSVTSATTLFTIADTSGYGSISVQVTSAGSATITYEASEDSTTWSAVVGYNLNNNGTSAGSSTTTTATQTAFPLIAKQFRARVSTYTSGTVTVLGTLRKDQIPRASITVGNTVTTVGSIAEAAAVGSTAIPTTYEGRTTNKTAVTTGQYVRPIATSVGAAVNKPFQVPELDWSYPAAAGGISNTTTAVTMVAAAGAGIRNYLTSVQLSAGALGAATEVAIRDGAGGTVIWRGFLSTSGGAVNAQLSSPIKSTANTLLEVVTLTATITGAVYVNAQGYQAP